MNVCEKVKHAFFDEEAHIAAELKLLCRSVSLKRLPDELNSNGQEHQCAESELDDIYNLCH